MRIKKTIAEELLKEQRLTVTLEKRVKMKLCTGTGNTLTLTTSIMEFNQHMLIKNTGGTMLVIAGSVTRYWKRNFKAIITNEMIWKTI